MNSKLIKNLRTVSKKRRMDVDTWIKAYKIMPLETQKRFADDLSKEAKAIRNMPRFVPPRA